jgi:hypothetical protein
MTKNCGTNNACNLECRNSSPRQGIEWVSLLFQLKSGANIRPIDQIERVLNHDKKLAIL